MVRIYGALIVGTALLLASAGTAVAGHNPTITSRCTYEVPDAAVAFTTNFAIEDPTGLTSDGAWNKAICGFHFPDSDPGENADWGPFSETFHTVVSGVNTFSGQYSTAQATIVDDIFGSEIGGVACADLNHDHLCGQEEDGEPLFTFCGTSPIIAPGADTDGDGHNDLGWGLFVAVNDWYFQTLYCDPTAAPQSTTGGILNPHGGIYVTVSG